MPLKQQWRLRITRPTSREERECNFCYYSLRHDLADCASLLDQHQQDLQASLFLPGSADICPVITRFGAPIFSTVAYNAGEAP